MGITTTTEMLQDFAATLEEYGYAVNMVWCDDSKVLQSVEVDFGTGRGFEEFVNDSMDAELRDEADYLEVRADDALAYAAYRR